MGVQTSLVRFAGPGRLVVAFAFLVVAAASGAFGAGATWPSLQAQLQESHVRPDSALAKFVAENQDFSILDPSEAHDTRGVPPWLRVAWRKAHPEIAYAPLDPTGGYPRVLRNVLPWMLRHQDLLRGSPDAATGAWTDSAQVGSNLRISGSSPYPRSESGIAIDTWNSNEIIGAANDIGAGLQAQFYSSNGGLSWGQSSLPLASNDFFHSDPSVDWTSDGTSWAMMIGLNAVGTVLKLRWYTSVDGGATWTFDSTVSGKQSAADKPMSWVDRSATSPFEDYAYGIWHNGGAVYMNRKDGIVGTWNSTPTRVSGSETTGTGIGGDVKTNGSGDVFGL